MKGLLWKILKRTSAIEMDIRMNDEGVPITAENIIAAAEAVANERCEKERERFKRCLDSINDTNGHTLDPEFRRVTEIGRASLK